MDLLHHESNLQLITAECFFASVWGKEIPKTIYKQLQHCNLTLSHFKLNVLNSWYQYQKAHGVTWCYYTGSGAEISFNMVMLPNRGHILLTLWHDILHVDNTMWRGQKRNSCLDFIVLQDLLLQVPVRSSCAAVIQPFRICRAQGAPYCLVSLKYYHTLSSHGWSFFAACFPAMLLSNTAMHYFYASMHVM